MSGARRARVALVLSGLAGCECRTIETIPSGGGSPGAGGGGAMPHGGSGGEPSDEGGGGYGGACHDGYIELGGPTGERLESVCDFGQELTDRPVGFFYSSGPQAGGDLRINGCDSLALATNLFITFASSPGSGLNGNAHYEKGGVSWETVSGTFSGSIEPFSNKVGTTMAGSYSATVTNGTETLDLFGDFRVCRVNDDAP
jgi:hypothetical protein